MKKIIILSIIFIQALPAWLMAQPDKYKEDVVVVAPYKPVISDANKIEQNPTVKDSTYPKPDFKYTILPALYPTTYTPEPIEAAKMAAEPIDKLYENLLKLGFGNYVTPYAEYFFNSTRSRQYAYGAHVKHISSTGKIEDYAYPGYSQNSLSVFGKYFKDKKFTLSGDAGFDREVVHFYGFKPDEIDPVLHVSKEDLKQRFNLFHFNTGIQSAYDDPGKLSYNTNLSFYHLYDFYHSNETNLKLSGGIARTQELLKISNEQRWGINGAVDFYRDEAEFRKAGSRALITLQPFISAQRGALSLQAGFNTTFEADTTTYVHFYPEIELGASLIPDYLTLHAGMTGMMIRDGYKATIDENPYVNPAVLPGNRNIKYKFYGGFNANIVNLFDLSFEISKSQVEGQYFYVNDTSVPRHNMFELITDDDCSVFDLKTELAWKYSERFRLLYRFHLHQYYTSEALPWHISDYDMDLALSYHIQDKLLLDAGVIYYDRMYALTYSPAGHIESKYLRDRIDVHFGAEYRYSRLISVFLRLNNIAGIRYYYWNDYPSQRFNFMGGLTFSF